MAVNKDISRVPLMHKLFTQRMQSGIVEYMWNYSLHRQNSHISSHLDKVLDRVICVELAFFSGRAILEA